MKFLIIDTYYPDFLRSIYSRTVGLSARDYISQKKILLGQCFGTADFYSSNLERLGHEASEIIANAESLQAQWCRENGIKLDDSFWRKMKARMTGTPRNGASATLRILEQQIKRASPDVLYFQDLSLCPPAFLSSVRQYCRLCVGQIACPLPPEEYLRGYHLLITSLPNYVEQFRTMGLRAAFLPLGFEPNVLERVGRPSRTYDCTFVGGFSPYHRQATSMLEEAARRTRIDFFGYGAETLSPDSPIRRTHHGEVWGLDMYNILMRSKVTINRHIAISGDYANNMRLYESTGCGAMLITDWKKNLGDQFVIGKELVTYRDVEELCGNISRYQSDDAHRDAVANQGQRRTLHDHTYFQRIEELVGIVKERI